MTGWPKYAIKVRHHLIMSEGLVLYKDGIVVPKKMRLDILQHIHDEH